MYESGIVDCTGDNKRGTLHMVRLPGWTLGRLACALFLRGSGLLCLDCSFSWCCPRDPTLNAWWWRFTIGGALRGSAGMLETHDVSTGAALAQRCVPLRRWSQQSSSSHCGGLLGVHG